MAVTIFFVGEDVAEGLGEGVAVCTTAVILGEGVGALGLSSLLVKGETSAPTRKRTPIKEPKPEDDLRLVLKILRLL